MRAPSRLELSEITLDQNFENRQHFCVGNRLFGRLEYHDDGVNAAALGVDGQRRWNVLKATNNISVFGVVSTANSYVILRIATLNLEQDHKCWAARRELIAAQLRDINPDIWALNEIHITSRTGRWLQQAASKVTGTPLQEPSGAPTHPESERFDRCIDYIWISQSIKLQASGLCFNQPAKDNPELWPSDHIGVWADLAIG